MEALMQLQPGLPGACDTMYSGDPDSEGHPRH